MKRLFTLAASGLLTFALAAHAEECTAKADTKSIWEVKEGSEDRGGAEYKVKFRVSSEDCKKEDCTGFILYDSRYVLGNGRAYRHHHTIDYRIERGENLPK